MTINANASGVSIQRPFTFALKCASWNTGVTGNAQLQQRITQPWPKSFGSCFTKNIRHALTTRNAPKK
jgi:hypothetical protein